MEPLRITFRLATPVVAPTHPIHLDAVLAWAAVDEAGGDVAAQEDIGLQRFQGDNGACWQASQILLRTVWRDQLLMTRAFTPWQWADDRDVRYAGGPKSVTAGTGPYKAYQLNFAQQQAPEAVAWAIGDRQRITQLLRRVNNLGKLARIGCGEIAETIVTPDDAAEHYWALRVMPSPMDGYYQSVETTIPPYWDRTHRQRAWAPSSAHLAEARRALGW